MVINPKYRLDLAVSKDGVHPAENHIFINNETAVACDNHILAIVPVQMEEGDSAGLIPVDALKAARKGLKKDATKATINANGIVSVVDAKTKAVSTWTRPNETYPPYKAIIPDYKPEEIACQIAIDAELLARLAGALGNDRVILTIPKDALSNPRAILVKTTDSDNTAHGLIMPVRLS